MFTIKQCFVVISVHKYFHRLKKILFINNCSVEINISTFYRLIFLLAVIVQYYALTKFFEIRNSAIVLRATSANLVIDMNEELKLRPDWLKLKRSYFRRRLKWKVPKNATGVKLGSEFLFHHGKSVYTVNLGPEQVSRERRSLKWLENNIPEIKLGGFYAPKHCRSMHKIAILVPYKNRPRSLVTFLNNLHRILPKQLVQYRVFIIEQYGSTIEFNKGSLYNVAYIESQKFGEWHCLVFHDVDLLLQDSRNLYTCAKSPIHLSPSVESQNYKLPYPELVGGVTAMTPAHYVLINGYSNSYWDWGAEDDDLYIRFTENKLGIHRASNTTGVYAHTNHRKNRVNVYRYLDLEKTKRRHKKDGLNSVAYKLVNITKRKLFTHILADVNPYNFTI